MVLANLAFLRTLFSIFNITCSNSFAGYVAHTLLQLVIILCMQIAVNSIFYLQHVIFAYHMNEKVGHNSLL